MGKIGLIALGTAAFALYLLIGGDDQDSKQPQAPPAVVKAPALRTQPPSRTPAPAPQRWQQTPDYSLPGGAYGAQDFAGYPAPGGAMAPGYQFRPLAPNERQRQAPTASNP